mgnify:CR=1 FL=1
MRQELPRLARGRVRRDQRRRHGLGVDAVHPRHRQQHALCDVRSQAARGDQILDRFGEILQEVQAPLNPDGRAREPNRDLANRAALVVHQLSDQPGFLEWRRAPA